MRKSIFASLIILFCQSAFSQQSYQYNGRDFTVHESHFNIYSTPVYGQTINLSGFVTGENIILRCRTSAAELVQSALNECAERTGTQAYSDIETIESDSNKGFWLQCDSYPNTASKEQLLGAPAYVGATIFGLVAPRYPNKVAVHQLYQKDPSDKYAQKIAFAEACNSELSKFFWIRRVTEGN